MKNLNSKKKLRAVLIATILGAVLFGTLLPLANLSYSLWKHGYINDYWWNTIFNGLGYFFVMPADCICYVLFGKEFSSWDAFIINPIIGAVVFALIAIVWQSSWKNGPKKKLNQES
jgi:hypothetical protein